ncbi:MAG: hypothetical protein LBN07_04370 [Christensenellaceae bacterium]|jgi:hypothetical protein|nr:hypothetical protein [Christensenellaceae bacterium]
MAKNKGTPSPNEFLTTASFFPTVNKKGEVVNQGGGILKNTEETVKKPTNWGLIAAIGAAAVLLVAGVGYVLVSQGDHSGQGGGGNNNQNDIGGGWGDVLPHDIDGDGKISNTDLALQKIHEYMGGQYTIDQASDFISKALDPAHPTASTAIIMQQLLGDGPGAATINKALSLLNKYHADHGNPFTEPGLVDWLELSVGWFATVYDKEYQEYLLSNPNLSDQFMTFNDGTSVPIESMQKFLLLERQIWGANFKEEVKAVGITATKNHPEYKAVMIDKVGGITQGSNNPNSGFTQQEDPTLWN